MKLENFGVFVISNFIMKRMSIMDLLELFRIEPGGWEREQTIRLQWLQRNQPDYYKIVKSGDIEACMLYGLSTDLTDCNISDGGRASIWVNGQRIGSIDYFQTREFRKFTATFYGAASFNVPSSTSKKSLDSDSGKNIFLLEHPQFKNNMGRHIWIRRN